MKKNSRQVLKLAARIVSLFICVVFITATSAAQTCAPAPVTLVSWWPGDGNALDARSRNDVTLQNGAGYAGGKVGQSYSFDGINDSAEAGNWFTFTTFTIEMWVKPGSSQVEYADIIDNNHTNSQNWVLQQNGGNTNSYCFSGASCFSLTPNVWQHFAVTHDSSNAVTVYVNGAIVATGAFAINYNGTQNLRFGRWGNSLGLPSDRNWNGQLDEIAVYDRALSTTEIQAIFTAGTAGKCKPTATVAPSGLVGFWAGDGGANDIIGSNGGALRNGAGFAVGKVGQSFNLDGVNDYIQTDLDVQPSAMPSVTFESWVFPRNPTGEDQAIFSGDDGGWDRQVGISPDGASFAAQTGSPASFNPVSVTYNQWQHIAVVYTPTDIKLYKNGVEYVYGSAPTGQSSLNKLALGSNRCPPCVGNSATQQFAGLIDEASVYSRALTQAEIASIYNAGIAGKLKTSQLSNTNNVISEWRAENTANDSLATNNGALNGGTTFATGKFGQSFSLDGIDDEVSIPDSPSLNFATNAPLTIELWAYRTSTSGLQHLIGKRTNCDGSPINYQIAYSSNQIFFGSGGGNEIAGGQDLPLNTWTHIAGTFDGTTLRLYMNGVLVGSVNGSLGDTTTTPLLIGGSGSCSKFGGKLDEVTIYNRALSAAEIQSISQGTRTGDASINFAGITNAGEIQQIPIDLSLFPSLPGGSTATGLAYDIATSAAFSGSPLVCFNLPSVTESGTFNNLRILHLENDVWINRTDVGSINFASKTICTNDLTSLSPFAIVNGFAPTAASASVSGRVLTSNGRGIVNVVVSVTNTRTGETRSARSGTFGFYFFDELDAGDTYVLTATSRKLTFNPSTRVLSLRESISDEDFVADSGGASHKN